MEFQGVEGTHCRAGTVAAQFLGFFHEYLRISAPSAVSHSRRSEMRRSKAETNPNCWEWSRGQTAIPKGLCPPAKGSSRLATLGSGPESLWDSREFPKAAGDKNVSQTMCGCFPLSSSGGEGWGEEALPAAFQRQHPAAKARTPHTVPSLQYSNTPILHPSNTPILQYSIPPILHPSTTPSLHYSIPPLLHPSTTPLIS